MTLEHSWIRDKRLAKDLDVSLGTVRRWRLFNQGPPYRKLGGLIRYDPKEVEQWLKTRPAGGSSVR